MLIVVLIIPQTRLPVRIFVNRLLSFEPSVLEEQPAIDTYQWSLRDLAGKKINFSSSKGKVALVNFWATWCAPCIAEMPDFQLLYNDYGKKVDFYFVTNDKKQNVERFLQENEYELPIFYPLQQAPKTLMGQALPATFLIDKKGNIVVKEFGTADWNSEAMRKILDQLLKTTSSENGAN